MDRFKHDSISCLEPPSSLVVVGQSMQGGSMRIKRSQHPVITTGISQTFNIMSAKTIYTDSDRKC